MPDWLTARPVAHRGLHDAAVGVIENTATAFTAAIAGHYAIECDLQLSADGEAMVHHDDQLGRLTDGAARLDALSAAELKQARFRATADRMLTLGELCDLVARRVTLVLELKSRFDGDPRLPRRVAEVLAGYRGPVAVMSFDPAAVAALREIAPAIPRGLVAQKQDKTEGHHERQASPFSFASQTLAARLAFLAYRVQDLDSPMPRMARNLFGLSLLTWTVRTAAERERAVRFADQMIFEGFRP